MSELPARLLATGAETAISITRAVTHHRIGLALAFEGERLDPDRLARATRLSLDAEPVLGCAFRTDEAKAYWERLTDLDGAHYFTHEAVSEPDASMTEFQAAEVADEGPQSSVALFSAPDGDHVGIKVSHVAADGQAAKQYAYLLAEIYTRLGADPALTVEPHTARRPSGRDVWENLTTEQRKAARKAKSWTNPTWDIPTIGSGGKGLAYSWRTVGPAEFEVLKAWGKRRGATVNDVMLTAVFRACVAEFDPPRGKPLSLMCTADLRRYLPAPEQLPIANVSISGSLDIERVDGESFEDTSVRVRQKMEAWARTCYGAGPMMSAERLAGLGYRVTSALLRATFRMAGGSGKSYPWFTNIGILDDARLSFGGLVPSAGHLYGPAAIGPSIVPVVSTYRGVLTVCMGFCERDMEWGTVSRVLDAIIAELDVTRDGE